MHSPCRFLLSSAFTGMRSTPREMCSACSRIDTLLGRPEFSQKSSLIALCLFRHWNLQLLYSVRLAGQPSHSRNAFVSTSPALVLKAHTSRSSFLHVYWGSQPSISYLYSKHFTELSHLFINMFACLFCFVFLIPQLRDDYYCFCSKK